jgi:hypothetical protein
MKAYILSLNKDAHLTDQWDYGMLKDLLEGRMWQTPDWENFEIEQTEYLTIQDRAIVAIAARHHAGYEDQINEELDKIGNCVLFLMGDEEADFDVEKIRKNNMHVWIQNPHMGKHDNYDRIGTGYPQHIHSNLPDKVEKDIDIFFAGQITHNRRTELVDALENVDMTKRVIKTEGFTQGMKPKEYYRYLASANFAPCPSGAVIPDSFRLFEALECMAIPIADQKTPGGDKLEYWDWLFKSITPFPKLDNWYVLESAIAGQTDNPKHYINIQTEWWIKWKRNFVYKVMEQLHA